MTVQTVAPALAAQNVRGIVAMLIAMASFVAGDTVIKIVGRDLPLGQIMFTRGLMASSLILLLAWRFGALRPVPRSVVPALTIRTLCEIGATITFFSGLFRLPFADVAAIGQFTPLAVTAGAALFFGERVGWRRWTATFVGLVGVLIIIRPGTSAFDWAALFIVAAVGFVSVRDLITRRIGASIHTFLITALATIVITLAGLALAPFEVWQPPTTQHLVMLAIGAVSVLSGYYWVIVAMRTGEISVVAPFRYSVMLFAIVSGIVVFQERPDAMTWIGIAIVIGAGLYMFHRERVVRRLQRVGA